MNQHEGVAEIAVVFDFDQTIGETSRLAPLRERRDWIACNRAANSAMLFEGIGAALQQLAADGVALFIASSAPRRYLDPFLQMLPTSFRGVYSYRSPRNVGGLTRRAAIKREQLLEIRDKVGPATIVFVGDDVDDAAAASSVGVPFIHACWGAECVGISGAHPGCVAILVRTIETVAGGV